MLLHTDHPPLLRSSQGMSCQAAFERFLHLCWLASVSPTLSPSDLELARRQNPNSLLLHPLHLCGQPPGQISSANRWIQKSPGSQNGCMPLLESGNDVKSASRVRKHKRHRQHTRAKHTNDRVHEPSPSQVQWDAVVTMFLARRLFSGVSKASSATRTGANGRWPSSTGNNPCATLSMCQGNSEGL
jgi:hypothetical protein